MATYTLSAPAVGLTAPKSATGTREYFATHLRKKWKEYGKYFAPISVMTKVPIEVLVTWAFIESNISPTASTGATTGMMQWDRTAGFADKVLTREFQLGRLSEAEKAVLKKHGVKWTTAGVFSPITATQQLNPELNILIGAIYLGQYMDSIAQGAQKPEFATEKGEVRLDRMIPLYNAGENSADAENAYAKKFKTPLETANNAKKTVTRDYIAKALGKGGAMDLLSSDLRKDLYHEDGSVKVWRNGVVNSMKSDGTFYVWKDGAWTKTA